MNLHVRITHRQSDLARAIDVGKPILSQKQIAADIHGPAGAFLGMRLRLPLFLARLEIDRLEVRCIEIG